MSELLNGIALIGLGTLFSYMALMMPSVPLAYRLWLGSCCLFIFLRGLSRLTDYHAGIQPYTPTLDYISGVLGLALVIITIPVVPWRLRHFRLSQQTDTRLKDDYAQQTGKLKASDERHRKLVGQLVAAGEEERRQLAYHVHDGPTQTAAAAHQHLQAFHRIYQTLPNIDSIEERNSLHENIQDDLESALILQRRTVKDLRSIIGELRPTVLDEFGLAVAIQQKVNDLCKDGWSITYELHEPDNGYQQRPHPIAETALFQIAIEALNNIKKHAQATHIHVALSIVGRDDTSPQVTLCVTDDGVGFAPNGNGPTGSGPGERIGLASMQERVDLLGGRLTIDAFPGNGTTICAEIPLQDDDDHPDTDHIQSTRRARGVSQ